MLWQLTSNQFNFIEGVFWIFLGIIVVVIRNYVPKDFRALGQFAGITLLLFGISDFLQVIYGSFFQPRLWWLLAWKVGCVAGLVVCVVWYLRIRFAK